MDPSAAASGSIGAITDLSLSISPTTYSTGTMKGAVGGATAAAAVGGGGGGILNGTNTSSNASVGNQMGTSTAAAAAAAGGASGGTGINNTVIGGGALQRISSLGDSNFLDVCNFLQLDSPMGSNGFGLLNSPKGSISMPLSGTGLSGNGNTTTTLVQTGNWTPVGVANGMSSNFPVGVAGSSSSNAVGTIPGITTGYAGGDTGLGAAIKAEKGFFDGKPSTAAAAAAAAASSSLGNALIRKESFGPLNNPLAGQPLERQESWLSGLSVFGSIDGYDFSDDIGSMTGTGALTGTTSIDGAAPTGVRESIGLSAPTSQSTDDKSLSGVVGAKRGIAEASLSSSADALSRAKASRTTSGSSHSPSTAITPSPLVRGVSSDPLKPPLPPTIPINIAPPITIPVDPVADPKTYLGTLQRHQDVSMLLY